MDFELNIIASRQKETVVELLSAGRSAARVLEVARGAIFLLEHLISRFEAAHELPRPIACGPGCSFCCMNQVQVTPPEALLIGHHLAATRPPTEIEALLARVAAILALTAGKTRREVAVMRRELPCPLLREGLCSVYPVRPLACRAMHALDKARCEASLAAADLVPDEYYPHHHDFALAVARGLLEGCREIGCQAGALDLPLALQSFFQAPRPVERWAAGEAVFPG